MSAVETFRAAVRSDPLSARRLGIFTSWRLCAYAGILSAIYVMLLLSFYRAGIWLLDSKGMPIYCDFILPWLVAIQALHGQLAPIYDPVEFLKLQEALVGPRDFFYPNWPYPPTFFLYLVLFAMLTYVYAFIAWGTTTLLGCMAVVYLIVRRFSAVVLVLASPLTAWVLFAGQNGLLWASLLGASLYFLEGRPVLAGVFIGLLTFKPQFGLLLPVALIAASQWRAFASAAGTTAILIGASIAAFGTAAWAAFPLQLAAQTSLNLFANPDAHWEYQQTVYGLIRALHGGAAAAWLTHTITAAGTATIVWLVWRSSTRYALKAATLSAAALIVTPYAFATDMAAIAIPAAFLAVDQIRCGLLRGEQTIMIALFGASLVVLLAAGGAPLGLFMMMTLLAVILRRLLLVRQEAAA